MAATDGQPARPTQPTRPTQPARPTQPTEDTQDSAGGAAVDVPALPWSTYGVGALECGRGWYPLLAALDTDLRALVPGYTVDQVKEKFGGLRFYISALHDVSEDVAVAVNARIRAAEEQAGVTCEQCGQPGELRGGGWLRVLCDGCEQARIDARQASPRS